MKKIPLTLAKEYVSDWGIWEAVRELIQNAIDTGTSEILFDWESNKIVIKSASGAIPVQHLLLGSGTKKDDENAIGGFSEGMKLAFLVLARKGHFLDICNGRDKWYTSIEYNPMFEAEHLHVTVKENALPVENADKVTMTIEGFSTEELELIDQNYIPFEEFDDINVAGNLRTGYAFNPSHNSRLAYRFSSEEFYAEEFEEEIADYTPKLYVNGLYVCDLNNKGSNDFRYSYNFPPNKLKLDRDRNAVDKWDLQYEVATMLIINDNVELIARLAKGQYKDVEGYSNNQSNCYGSVSGGQTFNTRLGTQAWATFQETHGLQAVPINSCWNSVKKESFQKFYREMGRFGVEISNSHFEMLTNFIPKFEAIEQVKTFKPLEYLKKFLEDNKRHMRGKAKRELKNQIKLLELTKTLI